MNILQRISFIIIAAIGLWSCEKDEDRIVAQTNGTAPTLNATATSVVLQDADATKDAITYTWTASDFGYSAAVKYSLQLGRKDSNFVNARTIDLGNSKTVKYTVKALNTIAIEMGLKAFEANNLQVRIKAQISDKYAPAYSNVVNLAVTPYLTEPPYATVYLVGDATEFGWDNNKPTPVFRDETDPFIYTFTGKLKAGNIKFLGTPGKWAPQWGTNSGGTALVFRETEAAADPGSISIASAGYYTVKLNLRNNSFSVAPYDATGKREFTSIGIIGDFNDWSTIAPMTKSSLDPHYWELGSYTFANDAQLKFRIAAGWDYNWGAVNDESASNAYGKGLQGGKNIKVKAGKYRILFSDLDDGRYILLKQ